MTCKRCQGSGVIRIADLWPEVTMNTNMMRCDECHGDEKCDAFLADEEARSEVQKP